LSRAQYLISQHSDSAIEETETLEDREFIIEVMDAREDIESASGIEELERILDENQS
jgi:molecular chaperone HscB